MALCVAGLNQVYRGVAGPDYHAAGMLRRDDGAVDNAPGRGAYIKHMCVTENECCLCQRMSFKDSIRPRAGHVH